MGPGYLTRVTQRVFIPVLARVQTALRLGSQTDILDLICVVLPSARPKDSQCPSVMAVSCV